MAPAQTAGPAAAPPCPHGKGLHGSCRADFLTRCLHQSLELRQVEGGRVAPEWSLGWSRVDPEPLAQLKPTIYSGAISPPSQSLDSRATTELRT